MKQSKVSKLFYSGSSNYTGETILRVAGNPDLLLPSDKNQAILLCENESQPAFCSKDFENRLIIGQDRGEALSGRVIRIPDKSLRLDDGDIVHIYSAGDRARLTILYRIASDDNTLVPTNKCNSACVMCPQPSSGSFHEFGPLEMTRIIGLIDKSTKYLGISGGEPTLIKDRLVEMLSLCADHLPSTKIGILTNGRMLSYLSYVDHINSVGNRDIIFCIPLHSYQADDHDKITRVTGSFQQTTRGINNLLNKKAKIEIRVVIQKANYNDLPRVARYITEDFAGVNRVVFLGMEVSGQAAKNVDRVWVNLEEIRPFLEEAIIILLSSKIGVAIYNVPLCKISGPFRTLCADSISDYKVRYLPECDSCGMKIRCGGIFAASIRLYKAEGVSPINVPAGSPSL